MVTRMTAVCFALIWGACGSVCAATDQDQDALLVILTETGRTRDGLPVLTMHPQAEDVAAVLSRGFSGRLLRLYRFEQEYLRRMAGSSPEPAYLLLSNQQGGFPRFGFYLDEVEKRQVGYVDLHRSGMPTGRFGSMDQIFPHELVHIIMRQLAGEPEPGGSNQTHAIGVRTDPRQAFSEGFAEHVQVMAVDDPDAEPATRALAADAQYAELADRQARRYRNELGALWSPAGPMRMGFLFWFSGIEQVWRYHAVKANAFARETPIPESMMSPARLYGAYLLQNALPGDPGAPAKSAGVMVSTEGVVSSLLYRWTTDEEIRRRFRDEDFYALFGVARTQVTPLDNVYLKLFHVLFVKKPADIAALIAGYTSVFPDEAPFVDKLVRDTMPGFAPSRAAPNWMANRDFQTGTSLFDQFRSIPRTHTFDLNAATMVDLLGVPGMTRNLAERILAAAPFESPAELKRIPDMPSSLADRFLAMKQEMERMASEGAEEETVLNLNTILWSYGKRALLVLALSSVAGAFLYRRVRAVSRVRSGVNGCAASFVVLSMAWLITGSSPAMAFLAPVVLLGIPAALWQGFRRHDLSAPARTLLAWAGAALPAVALAYPWF